LLYSNGLLTACFWLAVMMLLNVDDYDDDDEMIMTTIAELPIWK